jgi:hypothetical protein
MARIYIDTNCLLDFYQAALDRIEVLDDLLPHTAHLVFTRQTINEFQRNRIARLNSLIRLFQDTTTIPSPHATSLVNAIPQYEELMTLRKQYLAKAKDIVGQLKSMAESEGVDAVAQRVYILWVKSNRPTLEITDDIVDRAWRRKLLGNPPTSPDKYTIGDEVIWECLLAANLGDDLIIVTRDKSYLANQLLLKVEYSKTTKRNLILVTERFSDALKAVGEAPSQQLLETEQNIDELAETHEFLKTVEDFCAGKRGLDISEDAGNRLIALRQQLSEAEGLKRFGIIAKMAAIVGAEKALAEIARRRESS